MATMLDRMDARHAQMLKELQSDMADLVEVGELTDQQANEWVNDKAEQWAAESRNTVNAPRFVDTCIEHAYGQTTRLSFQIRVF